MGAVCDPGLSGLRGVKQPYGRLSRSGSAKFIWSCYGACLQGFVILERQILMDRTAISLSFHNQHRARASFVGVYGLSARLTATGTLVTVAALPACAERISHHLNAGLIIALSRGDRQTAISTGYKAAYNPIFPDYGPLENEGYKL